MKSKKYTVTSVSLNTGNAQEVELILVDENSIERIPDEIVIENNSGCEVGIVYLDNDAEKTLFTSTPAYFDYIPLDGGKTSSVLPTSIQYMEIKKLSGTATGNINIYGLSYVRKND